MARPTCISAWTRRSSASTRIGRLPTPALGHRNNHLPPGMWPPHMESAANPGDAASHQTRRGRDMYTVDIDTGGTMTDGLVWDGTTMITVKVDTTPHDLTVSFRELLGEAASQLGF